MSFSPSQTLLTRPQADETWLREQISLCEGKEDAAPPFPNFLLDWNVRCFPVLACRLFFGSCVCVCGHSRLITKEFDQITSEAFTFCNVCSASIADTNLSECPLCSSISLDVRFFLVSHCCLCDFAVLFIDVVAKADGDI